MSGKELEMFILLDLVAQVSTWILLRSSLIITFQRNNTYMKFNLDLYQRRHWNFEKKTLASLRHSIDESKSNGFIIGPDQIVITYIAMPSCPKHYKGTPDIVHLVVIHFCIKN